MQINIQSFKKQRLYILHAIVYLVLLFFSFEYSEIAYRRDVDISLSFVMILVACFYLLSTINNVYSLIIGYFWLWWMLLGITNAAAWSILHSDLDLDVEKACLIYSTLFLSFLLGVFFFDKKIVSKQIDLRVKPNLLWCSIILVFPILMITESYLALGYIPILSGVSIIDNMYNASYGKLYGYKSVMIFSIIISVYFVTYFNGKDKVKTLIFSSLTLAFLMIALFDGKRVIFLCSLISIFVYMNKLYGSEYIKSKLIYYISIIFITYTGISSLRSGRTDSKVTSIDEVFYSVGGEFRDFIWTVTNYEPGEIPNYSWVLSSLGSFVNGKILSILGFDKNTLVTMDSARSWMNIFEIDLGIRTGIFSEFWFEFGFFAVISSFILGVFVSKVCTDIYHADTIKSLIFKVFTFSFLFLAVMGQSSLLFGVLITCIYIFIIYSLIEYVVNKRIKFN